MHINQIFHNIEEGKWNVYKFIWQPKLKSYINQITKKHRQGLQFIGLKELTLIVIHTFPSYSIFRIFVHHWQFNKTERRLRLLCSSIIKFLIICNLYLVILITDHCAFFISHKRTLSKKILLITMHKSAYGRLYVVIFCPKL